MTWSSSRSVLHAHLQCNLDALPALKPDRLSTLSAKVYLSHTCTKAMRHLYEVTEHSSSSHLSTSSRTPTHLMMNEVITKSDQLTSLPTTPG